MREPADTKAKFRGRLLLVTAAVLWSSGGFLAKAPVFSDWADPAFRGTLLAFWRSLLAALVLAPFVRRPRWTPGLIPMALAFAVMTVTYLSAMVLTTAANAIWLQATAPVWVFALGRFLLGDRATPRDWVLLAFGMSGVGLILACELRGDEMAGVISGLLSGLSFGVVVLMLRRLRREDATWMVALNHGVAAALLAPLVLIWGAAPTLPQTPYLIGLGVFQMGISYLCFARGVRTVSSHEGAGISLLEPTLLPIWVYLLWSETPAWWTVVGGGFILAGLIIRYIPWPGTMPTSRSSAAKRSGEIRGS